MKPLVLLVPGAITQRTGGYEYDRRIVAGLRARGWVANVVELDSSFPRPTVAALDDAARMLAAIPDGAIVIVDGLAFGAMPVHAEREHSRLRFVALVHMPLAAEIGIDREEVGRLEESERTALAAARVAIVTGRATVPALLSYGVHPERIAVIEPGTDRVPIARGSGSPMHLVSVAAVTPGKGHETLVRALLPLRQRDWRLTCAGSIERHPPTAARVRDLLRIEDLEDRVSLAGELDASAVAALYDSAAVFVHATLHETYGMVVAEALARGVPIVGSATGAIPDLVEEDAGLLVPPGDIEALTRALSRVLDDASLRERLAAGARRVRDRLPTWDDAAERMATLLTRLETDGLFAC